MSGLLSRSSIKLQGWPGTSEEWYQREVHEAIEQAIRYVRG
jgi:hypothetical protein